MATNPINSNRLQFLRRNKIYDSYEELVLELNGYFKNVSDTLVAEPFVCFYKEGEDVRLVLGIGEEGNAKYTLIDIRAVEAKLIEFAEEIENLGDITDELRAAIDELREYLNAETLAREEADEKLAEDIATEIESRIAAIQQLADVIGLVKNEETDKFEYHPDQEDDVIRRATTVTEAIDLLSKYMQSNNIVYIFEDTETVDLETVIDGNNHIITADVKLSAEDNDADTHDDNIIVKKADGIAAYIDINFDPTTRRLNFTKSSTATGLHTTTPIEIKTDAKLIKSADNDLVYHLIVDGVNAGSINIPEDKFVKSATYNEATKSLDIVWWYDNGEHPTSIPLTDLIDIYTAGDGITVSNNEISIKISVASEDFLTVDGNGLKLSGVQSAIDTSKADALNIAKQDATEKTNQALADAKEYTDAETNRATLKENEIIGHVDAGVDELSLYGVRNQLNAAVDNMTAYVDGEITAAKQDATDKTDAALVDANAHSDANLAIAKEYTDSKDSELNERLLGNATDGVDEVTLHGIINRIDSKIDSTIADAKSYADEQATNMATSKAQDALVAANAYTDEAKAELIGHDIAGVDELSLYGVRNRIDSVNTDLSNAIETAKNDVLAASEHDATEKTNQALADANDYTDGKIASAVSELKAYTDDAKAEVLGSSADNDTANTIYGVKSYADSKADQALADAKAYTDGEVAELAHNIRITKEVGSDLVYHLYINGENVDVINIPKDQFLEKVEQINSTTLRFTFITTAGREDRDVDLSDYLNIYTASDGISISDENKVSVRKSVGSEGFLKVDETGVAVVGVQTAIDTAKDEAINTAKTYTDTAKATAITEATNNAKAYTDSKVAELQDVCDSVQLVPNGELSYKLIVDGEDRGSFAIPKDQFLKKVERINGYTLRFTFITTEGEKEHEIDLNKLVDVYNNGNGITIDTATKNISVRKSDDSEDFLKIDETGVAVVGVQTAINTAKDAATEASAVYTDTHIATAIDTAAATAQSKAEQVFENAKEYTNEQVALAATNAETTAQTKAEQALADAKNYADAQDIVLKDTLKDYTDTKYNAAIADVNTKTTETLESAKEYADLVTKNAVLTSVANAKVYTDAAISNANAYADTNKTEAINDAKAYADVKKTEVLTEAKYDAQQKATQALIDAKSYANAQDDTKLISAKTYADNLVHAAVDDIVGAESDSSDSDTIHALRKRITEVAATTLNEAKTDATDKVNAAKSSANDFATQSIADAKSELIGLLSDGNDINTISGVRNRVDNKITELTNSTDVKFTQTLDNAKTYADGKVADEKARAEAKEKELTVLAIDTATVEMHRNATTNGTEVYADVKISDYEGNIITAKDNGLYAPQIDVEYDAVTNTISFTTGTTVKEFALAGIRAVQDIRYDDQTKYLIFEVIDTDNVKKTTNVSLAGLVPSIESASSIDSPIKINVTHLNEDGDLINLISAEVNNIEASAIKTNYHLDSYDGLGNVIATEDVTNVDSALQHLIDRVSTSFTIISNFNNRLDSVEEKTDKIDDINSIEFTQFGYVDDTFNNLTGVIGEDATTKQQVLHIVTKQGDIYNDNRATFVPLVGNGLKVNAGESVISVNIPNNQYLKIDGDGKLNVNVATNIADVNDSTVALADAKMVKALTGDIIDNLTDEEGILVAVDAPGVGKSLKHYDIVSGTNSNGTNVLEITNDKNNAQFKIDINTIDCGTFN